MDQDSAMDIVDLGAPARSANDARWAGGGVGDNWIGRRVPMLRRATPAQLSAVLLIMGFVLVMVSQLYPWVRVLKQPHDEEVPPSAGMLNGSTFLQIPYYAFWLVIFMCCGALLFATGSVRKPLFGAATGALASQLLIVLPVLHRPAILVDGLGDIGFGRLDVQHAAGSYCIIVAFVLIAASLVVAAGGRVFPGVGDGPPAQPPRPDQAAPRRGSMHDALAASVPADPGNGTADIVIGWSPSRIEVRSEEVPAEDVEIRPAANDHSQYQRPVRTDEASVG